MTKSSLRRALPPIVVLAVISPLACSAAPGDGSAALPGGGKCMPYKDAQQMTASVEGRNEEAFRRAVAEKGLEIVKLKGFTADKPGGSLDPVWSVKEGAEPTTRILAGPPGERACTGPDDSWLVFAKDASGRLVALQRRPQRGFEHVLTICGCEADAPARGCGMAPVTVQWYFELPDGVKFDREIEIAYPTEGTREAFAGRGEEPCPRPAEIP